MRAEVDSVSNMRAVDRNLREAVGSEGVTPVG